MDINHTCTCTLTSLKQRSANLMHVGVCMRLHVQKINMPVSTVTAVNALAH